MNVGGGSGVTAVVDVTGTGATVVSSTGAVGADVDGESMNRVEVLEVVDAVDVVEEGTAETTDEVELVVSLALAARTG